MRTRKLGDALRAILLATPFVGAAACSPPPLCTQGTSFSLPLDAGVDGANCLSYCEDNASGVAGCYEQFGSVVCCCGGANCMFTGRRPASLLGRAHAREASRIGSYFAHAARLEAASIEAFRVLRRELMTHRAPGEFLRAAVRAAHDETAHTAATASLARRYGAQPVKPAYGVVPGVRPLESIALENAIEGCARETFGALLALWQSRHAADPRVRAAMQTIAADEVRHAELAWAVSAWVEPRLSRAAKHRVVEAREAAAAELERDSAAGISEELVTIAGVPRPAVALDLARMLRQAGPLEA